MLMGISKVDEESLGEPLEWFPEEHCTYPPAFGSRMDSHALLLTLGCFQARALPVVFLRHVCPTHFSSFLQWLLCNIPSLYLALPYLVLMPFICVHPTSKDIFYHRAFHTLL